MPTSHRPRMLTKALANILEEPGWTFTDNSTWYWQLPNTNGDAWVRVDLTEGSESLALVIEGYAELWPDDVSTATTLLTRVQQAVLGWRDETH